MIQVINEPVQILPKTIRSDRDSQNHPYISETSASRDNPLDKTSRQFQFQMTATLPFSHIIRTRRGVTVYTSFSNCFFRF